MNEPDSTVIGRIEKPRGFEFDASESFRKLISSQFGGSPARAISELIQNAIDSYPSTVPFEKRPIEIVTTTDSLSVRDAGEGMGIERLRLLVTLGGTDKHLDHDKIGRFGIGFFSVFNPALGTSLVIVRTRSGEHQVVLEFRVDPAHPERPPALQTTVTADRSAGSAITVQFARPRTVSECLREAARFLRYFPCPVTINGQAFTKTVWVEAEAAGARFFKEGSRHGFLRSDAVVANVSILCKYEHVLDLTPASLSTGGYNQTGGLDDYRRRQVPYLPKATMVVNDNALNVTVSRDSVMLDLSYDAMVDTLRQNLLAELAVAVRRERDPSLIVANQYIFAESIRRYLHDGSGIRQSAKSAIEALARAKVYRLDGRAAPVSLEYIARHRSEECPVFHSSTGNNVKWLGGAFSHDFVVLPPECRLLPKTGGYYHDLFHRVFEDAVDLDTVRGQPELIKQLVQRGLVPPELLSPQCDLVDLREITEEEGRFLAELRRLLSQPAIRMIVEENLHLVIRSIEPVLFDLREKGMIVAVGLLDEDGKFLDGAKPDEKKRSWKSRGRALKLGLMRSHPVIRHLLRTNDPFRAYFALTYLARDLVACQRLLVPGSSFSNWVVRELVRQIRGAIVEHLLRKLPRARRASGPAAPS